MSIVDVQSRSTQSEQDYQDHRSGDFSKLLVSAQTNVERFSIELRVGSVWSRQYGEKSNGMVTISETGIVLAAGQSVVVEVAENIGVPYNMYGLVIPTGSLFLDRGIIIAAAKIEPAFKDRLKLRLVNISGEKRTIKSGDKIASAIFFPTEITEFHADRRKSTVTVDEQVSLPSRIGKWSKDNPDKIIGWVVQMLSSAVVATTLAWFIFPHLASRPPAPEPPKSAPAPSTQPSTAGPIINGAG